MARMIRGDAAVKLLRLVLLPPQRGWRVSGLMRMIKKVNSIGAKDRVFRVGRREMVAFSNHQPLRAD